MNENSIWHLFDPNSPGWLNRKLSRREYVSADDIVRVARQHPGCLNEPEIQAHILRLLAGEVVSPKGRHKASFGRLARICVAGMLVQEQIAEWRAGIGDDCPRNGRGEFALAETAYRQFGVPLGLSGPSLANKVSSLKSNPLFGE